MSKLENALHKWFKYKSEKKLWHFCRVLNYYNIIYLYYISDSDIKKCIYIYIRLLFINYVIFDTFWKFLFINIVFYEPINNNMLKTSYALTFYNSNDILCWMINWPALNSNDVMTDNFIIGFYNNSNYYICNLSSNLVKLAPCSVFIISSITSSACNVFRLIIT